MQEYTEATAIRDILTSAQRVLIMQADNPDADSLGSALALEQIIGDMGKEPLLYCGVDIPGYLRYLPGWDRVSTHVPQQFDASIIVDTSAGILFETLNASPERPWLNSRPCIVIDHHAVANTIPYASVVCNYPAVAAAEVVYELARQLDWPLNLAAKTTLAAGIMADSLGLTSEATSARSIHIVGELVGSGVRLAELEHARRELSRKTPELVHYKGELLQRVEYFAGNRVAVITIPWREIETYSPLYNPSMLVIDDMRLTTGTDVAIALKLYNDGHITGKIRCNFGRAIAADLAAHFGGGGHAYASGFKLEMKGRPFNEIKSECIQVAAQLLDNLEREQKNETLQHSDAQA